MCVLVGREPRTCLQFEGRVVLRGTIFIALMPTACENMPVMSPLAERPLIDALEEHRAP